MFAANPVMLSRPQPKPAAAGGGGSSVTLDVNAGAFQSIAGVSGGASGHDMNGMPGVSTTATSGILVAFILVLDTSGLSNIADGGSLTWTRRSTFLTPSSATLEMWSAPFSSAVTSDSIQFVTAGAAKFIVAHVQAFTGNNAATPWDANGALPNTSATAATITTSHANDMLLGIANAPTTPSSGAGWTMLANNNGFLVEVMQVSTTQSATGLGVTGGTIDGEIGDALQGA